MYFIISLLKGKSGLQTEVKINYSIDHVSLFYKLESLMSLEKLTEY